MDLKVFFFFFSCLYDICSLTEKLMTWSYFRKPSKSLYHHHHHNILPIVFLIEFGPLSSSRIYLVSAGVGSDW